MTEESGRKSKIQPVSAEGSESSSDLQMEPKLMLDLAHKAAELIVGRIEGLSEEDAWEGEFKQELETCC